MEARSDSFKPRQKPLNPFIYGPESFLPARPSSSQDIILRPEDSHELSQGTTSLPNIPETKVANKLPDEIPEWPTSSNTNRQQKMWDAGYYSWMIQKVESTCGDKDNHLEPSNRPAEDGRLSPDEDRNNSWKCALNAFISRLLQVAYMRHLIGEKDWEAYRELQEKIEGSTFYSTWVKPENQISLILIREKAKASIYKSLTELQVDIQNIKQNTEAYCKHFPESSNTGAMELVEKLTWAWNHLFEINKESFREIEHGIQALQPAEVPVHMAYKYYISKASVNRGDASSGTINISTWINRNMRQPEISPPEERVDDKGQVKSNKAPEEKPLVPAQEKLAVKPRRKVSHDKRRRRKKIAKTARPILASVLAPTVHEINDGIEGFQIPYVTCVIKHSSAHPHGDINWAFSCEHFHGFGHMCDRVPKIVSFLAAHSNCRPDWHYIARQEDETEEEHKIRMGKIFPYIGSVKHSEKTKHIYINSEYRIGRSGKNKWIKRKQGDFTERQKEKRHKSEARKRGNVLHRNDDQGQDALTFRHEDLASLLSDLPSCDSDFEMDGRDGLECSDADKSIESSPGLGWEYERQAETFEARSEGNHPKSTSSLMMNPREDFPAQSGGEISRDPRLRMGSNLSAMTSLPEEHGIPQAQNYLDSSEQGHAKLGSQDNGARVQEAENPAVLRGQKLLEETYMCAVPQEKTRESPKNQLAVINGSPGQIISNAEVHNEAGRKMFPRPREVQFIDKQMSSGPKILLITGPAQSGKKSVIQQLVDQRKAEGRGHHAIQIDSIEDVATEIYLSLVAWANHDNDQTSLLDTSKSFSLDTFEDSWQPVSERLATTKDRPQIYVHNVTSDKIQKSIEGLTLLLAKLLGTQIPVCLVAEDCSVTNTLRRAKIKCKVEAVGNLPKDDAKSFMKCIIENGEDASCIDTHWEMIHRTCGGNPGLLTTLAVEMGAFGEIEPALETMVYDCHEWRREACGEEDLAETCRDTAAYILKSRYRAVSMSSLLSTAVDVDDIRWMISEGVLLIREVSYLASDLPKEAYGPLREPILCLPSKLHEIMWEEVLQL